MFAKSKHFSGEIINYTLPEKGFNTAFRKNDISTKRNFISFHIRKLPSVVPKSSIIHGFNGFWCEWMRPTPFLQNFVLFRWAFLLAENKGPKYKNWIDAEQARTFLHLLPRGIQSLSSTSEENNNNKLLFIFFFIAKIFCLVP